MSDMIPDLSELTSKVKAALASHIDDKAVEAELASYASLLLPVTQSRSLTDKLTAEQWDVVRERALMGIDALTGDQPNLILARQIRIDLSAEVRSIKWPFLGPIINGISKRPLHAILFGMFLIGLPMLLLMLAIHQLNWWPEGWDNDLYWVITFATIGAMTSIAMRIDERANIYDNDPLLYFATGAFKPLVGIAIALVAASILKSRLLSIAGIYDADIDPDVVASMERTCTLYNGHLHAIRETLDTDTLGKVQAIVDRCVSHAASTKNFYASVIIGFLGGYSERFANDIISRAESQIVSSPQS